MIRTFAPATIAPAMIYLRQQRVRVKVMIGFLVRGRVRIKIRIRVRVGVRFQHWGLPQEQLSPEQMLDIHSYMGNGNGSL